MDLILKAFTISKKLPLPAEGSAVKIDEDFMKKYIIGGYASAMIEVHEYNGKKSNRVVSWVVPKELPKPAEPEPEPTFELTSEEDEGEDVPF